MILQRKLIIFNKEEIITSNCRLVDLMEKKIEKILTNED